MHSVNPVGMYAPSSGPPITLEFRLLNPAVLPSLRPRLNPETALEVRQQLMLRYGLS